MKRIRISVGFIGYEDHEFEIAEDEEKRLARMEPHEVCLWAETQLGWVHGIPRAGMRMTLDLENRSEDAEVALVDLFDELGAYVDALYER